MGVNASLMTTKIIWEQTLNFFVRSIVRNDIRANSNCWIGLSHPKNNVGTDEFTRSFLIDNIIIQKDSSVRLCKGIYDYVI